MRGIADFVAIEIGCLLACVLVAGAAVGAVAGLLLFWLLGG
jgi:uncharacterized membrane-anchored protein YjiN (DUF445 family)